MAPTETMAVYGLDDDTDDGCLMTNGQRTSAAVMDWIIKWVVFPLGLTALVGAFFA